MRVNRMSARGANTKRKNTLTAAAIWGRADFFERCADGGGLRPNWSFAHTPVGSS